jgi:hypothetical protein
MLKKTLVLIVVVMVSLTSMTSFATIEETTYDSVKLLSDVNNTTSGHDKTQAAKVENNENKNSDSQDSSKNDKTVPSTGWLIGMALLGFIMLSNRSGV